MYVEEPASSPEPKPPSPKLFNMLDLEFWYAPTAYHAYKMSLISCGITAVAALIGIIAYNAASSPAMLGFGLENMVDLFSSLVVVWRFNVAGNTEPTPALVAKLEGREKKASIAIAIILFILGVVVSSVAISHLAENEHGDSNGLLLGLSIPSVMIFGTMTVIKFRMADLLKSPSFRKDAMCSAFGTTLSFGVFFGTCVKSGDEGAWWIDGVVAVLTAVVCMWVGLRTLLKNVDEGIEWWTPAYWLTGYEVDEKELGGAYDMRASQGAGGGEDPNAI
jgi:divalent metal cation (Fe/Co/Zn/Cd) transporter